MATIVLTAVGGLIGGPIGAAIGSFAGQQIDRAVLGGAGTREGPRLKELAVTTSSYGSPIARHFGVMRVPGTIIWSTDLIESRQTSGGGKGKPKTTTYSYRASFAVALGSRPIVSIGRIWADGNLLRGSAGDLKTSGTMRVYRGYGDQPVDPLIASLKGGSAPAFRDTAYILFEDLQLGDFGNRIPALTFEVFSDAQEQVALGDLIPGAQVPATDAVLPQMLGYSDEGGAILSALTAIDQVYPLVCNAGDQVVEISPLSKVPTIIPVLPSALHSVGNNNDQAPSDPEIRRASGEKSEVRALRYYDRERDYQPGLQRALGRSRPGRAEVLDLPAALTADGARTLCSEQAQRSRWQGEQLTWRIVELDPSLKAGTLVRVPGNPGIWLIKNWEWSDEGILLALDRVPAVSGIAIEGHAGELFPPDDLPPLPTYLRALELPWDGNGDPTTPAMFAAMSAAAGNWSGATLFLEQGGALVPLDVSSNRRSVMGNLVTALTPSSSVFFDANATCEVELLGADLAFSSTTLNLLAGGTNRIAIGNEILQFLNAEPLTPSRWRLSGFLRGRGGTEQQAMEGQEIGASVLLLDDSLVQLDPAQVGSSPATRIAAMGFGDEEPAYALLEGSGATRRPLSPVHAKASVDSAGDWHLSWTRRARGQWRWEDYVETALIEEKEAYLVGFGPPDSPFAAWQVAVPDLSIESAVISSLLAANGPQPLWVRQIGTFGQSPATAIAQLS